MMMMMCLFFLYAKFIYNVFIAHFDNQFFTVCKSYIKLFWNVANTTHMGQNQESQQ